MLRIIDKKTNLFIRDDFTFDEEIEFGLEVEPAQGLFKPKWNGEKWVEGLTQEEIDELTKPQPHEPTVEERLAQTEELLRTVTMAFTEYVFTQDMSDDS
ncbi:hypothetical protein [Aerococcus urinaeequi]|uniref:hypothetical protein n=1 Tax=Aerococcus urinaeequi TaxID=51665 RepID=UPI003D6AADD5